MDITSATTRVWYKGYTVEPPNNGHSGDRPLVHCREVVPISEVMLQSVGGKQFVRSTEVVYFSECPLSEVPHNYYDNHIIIIIAVAVVEHA